MIKSEIRTLIWNRHFFGLEKAYDIFGNLVSKYDFEIDHIYPKSLNGSNHLDNLIVLSKISNQLKSYHLHGKINGRYFQIRKSYISGLVVGIIYINDVKIN